MLKQTQNFPLHNHLHKSDMVLILSNPNFLIGYKDSIFVSKISLITF